MAHIVFKKKIMIKKKGVLRVTGNLKYWKDEAIRLTLHMKQHRPKWSNSRIEDEVMKLIRQSLKETKEHTEVGLWLYLKKSNS
jgi:hypothetical protein